MANEPGDRIICEELLSIGQQIHKHCIEPPQTAKVQNTACNGKAVIADGMEKEEQNKQRKNQLDLKPQPAGYPGQGSVELPFVTSSYQGYEQPDQIQSHNPKHP